MEQKQNNKLTPTQAIEHLNKVVDLLEFYLGAREDTESKCILRETRKVQKLIKQLEDEKFQDRKAFKNKFLSIFKKRKENLEQENKELKIKLKKEQDKNG